MTSDLKDRIEAERKADVPGAAAAPFCSCPTCGVALLLLRVALARRKVRDFDLKRVSIRGSDCAGGAYPYLASVRVDGREVYRIHARPDEVFEPDVLVDIIKALRRPL